MSDAQEFKAGHEVCWVKHPRKPLWIKLLSRVPLKSWSYSYDHGATLSSRSAPESELVFAPRIIDVWDSPLAFAKDYFAEPERWKVIYSGQRVQAGGIYTMLIFWSNRMDSEDVKFYTIRRLADA